MKKMIFLLLLIGYIQYILWIPFKYIYKNEEIIDIQNNCSQFESIC